MIAKNIYLNEVISVRRLGRAFTESASTVGRWVGPEKAKVTRQRCCPVSGNPLLRARVRSLCDQPRNRVFGYRRIWALLRRRGLLINKKTVWRIMHELGLTRPKCRWPVNPQSPASHWSANTAKSKKSTIPSPLGGGKISAAEALFSQSVVIICKSSKSTSQSPLRSAVSEQLYIMARLCWLPPAIARKSLPSGTSHWP